MSLESSTQIGATYVWGFKAADAPNIGPGFVPRRAEITYEPEVRDQATDGEGHADSVTISKPEKRKWTTKFTGYITDEFDPESFPVSFEWLNRTHIIGPITVPKDKGKYAEVTIDAESLAGVRAGG